jgi:hypothetical protein
LIEVLDDFARGRDFREELFARSTSLLFLFQNGRAEFDTFAADVHIAGAFNQWADIAVVFATKRAVLFGVTIAGTASSGHYVFT